MNIIFQNIHKSSLNTAYIVLWIQCIRSSCHGCFCEVRARIRHICLCEYGVLRYDQLVLDVDQSIIYDISVDTDTAYSSKQRRWLELLKDYECEILYHLGKANVVAKALSRKARGYATMIKICKIQVHPSLLDQVKEVQQEIIREEEFDSK
ncbi:hypothetical protein Tco_0118460, partial [Tanacetum coccineum]